MEIKNLIILLFMMSIMLSGCVSQSISNNPQEPSQQIQQTAEPTNLINDDPDSWIDARGKEVPYNFVNPRNLRFDYSSFSGEYSNGLQKITFLLNADYWSEKIDEIEFWWAKKYNWDDETKQEEVKLTQVTSDKDIVDPGVDGSVKITLTIPEGQQPIAEGVMGDTFRLRVNSKHSSPDVFWHNLPENYQGGKIK